jgi:hypothetical protein
MAETARKIWSYVAGLGTAFVVILVLEAGLHFIFTMPSSADLKDPAAIDRAMRAMPTAAFVALLLVYIIGSVAGGLTAALVSDGSSSTPSIVTGCALTIAGAANVFAMYHPTWFRVASLLTYLPFSYLGCLAARGRKARH